MKWVDALKLGLLVLSVLEANGLKLKGYSPIQIEQAIEAFIKALKAAKQP